MKLIFFVEYLNGSFYFNLYFINVWNTEYKNKKKPAK